MQREDFTSVIRELEHGADLLDRAETMEDILSKRLVSISIIVGAGGTDIEYPLVVVQDDGAFWDDAHQVVTELANRVITQLKHKSRKQFNKVAEEMQLSDVATSQPES